MSEFIDPYIDPETRILRNLVNARTAAELRKAEGDIIFAAEMELSEIPHTRDLKELKSIHRKLFGKIYDWAGKLRIVNISRGNEEIFLDYPYLENGTRYFFDELAKENYLQNLSREKFVKKLAYFFEQLNYIHPFREGNGRTQRYFWQRIANDAGYEIAWEQVGDNEMNEASQKGKNEQNLKPLEVMFDKIVIKI